MRVVQAVALFPPDFHGGASLVCRRLADALAARGHTVDVFSGFATAGEPTGALHRGRLGELATWRVNAGGGFDPLSEEGFANPPVEDAFAAMLDAVRPDLVHLHSLQGLGVGLVDEAARRGIPIVLTMHDWWWLCPCLFRLSPAGRICPRVEPEECSGGAFAAAFLGRRRAALARALAKVGRVLVPSEFLRGELIANGLAAERIEVQENGIPRVETPPGGSTPVTEGPLRLLFVGGAGNRAKGIEVLLEAAVRLGEAPFLLRCRAVTAAEARPWADRLGARLECLPSFAPEEIDRVMADVDVVVVPSLMRESFSLVAREALARGKAVVTSDCGGPEEVVQEGRNGRVFRSGEPEDLARVLAELIADPTAARALRPTVLPRFMTPDEHAAAAEDVYRALLRTRPHAAFQHPAGMAAAAGRKVLFLTGIDGAPLRYRVWHLAERLAALGVRSEVLFHSDARAVAAAGDAQLLVIFRAPYGVTVAAAVARARRRGVPVLFAADDLVFSAELGGDAPALDDPRDLRAVGFRTTFDAYGRSARAADAFLGSTPELVEAAATLGLPGWVERNRLGGEWLALVEAGAEPRDRVNGSAGDGVLRLGYFSGTDTHDGDLASIAPALSRVLARFPKLHLVLGGPLRIPDELVPFSLRIETFALVPWSELPARLASVDVNLAPLELSRRFNRAKSEVKYLEAAALGIPTVASPSPAFRCASDEGRTALLADRAADWEHAIARLIEDRPAAVRLGSAARRDVLRRYSPDAALDELAEWLNGAFAARPRPTSLPSPLVLEAGGGSCVAIEPATARYDAYQLAYERGDPLGPDAEVEQAIRCRADGLARIDVRVGTYGRTNRHDVSLRVLDENGRSLGERTVPAEQMVDQSFVAVDLDEPLGDSRGRMVRVVATAPAAVPGNEILLWRAPSRRGGLTIGGRPCEGFELSFRAFSGAPA